METYTDFPAFLTAHKDDIFRYWVYRRMFTPYEQKECFQDESVFEDVYAEVGVVKECIPIGNGDFLIGFQAADDSDPYNVTVFDFIEYYKLSEIRLNLNLKNKEEE